MVSSTQSQVKYFDKYFYLLDYVFLIHVIPSRQEHYLLL